MSVPESQPPETIINDDMLDEAYGINKLRDLGLEDMSGDTISAHGRDLDFARLVGSGACPAMVEVVDNTVGQLKAIGVTDPQQVQNFIRGTLDSQANKAPESVTTEAEKK